MAVSVLTNWLATPGGLVNHGVSAFPALAFLVAVESLSAKPRPRRSAEAATEAEVVTASATAPAEPGKVAEPAATAPPVSATTAERVRHAAATLPSATAAAIAAHVGCSERTAYRYLRQGAATVPAMAAS